MNWQKLFAKRLMDARESAERELLGGRVPNFEHYRHLTGYLKGLQDAEDMAVEVVNDLNKGG